MTALDADTLRDLLAKCQPRPWPLPLPVGGRQGRRWLVSGRDYETVGSVLHEDDAALIVALVNAAPALLDDAEAVERIRTLADEWETPRSGTHHSEYVQGLDFKQVQCAAALRAALAPPPDRSTP